MTAKLPHELDAGPAPVIVHQHMHAATPIALTRDNCAAVVGVEPKRLRRWLVAIGVPFREAPGGVVALVSDVERALRIVDRDVKPANGPRDLEAEALARAGLRMVPR